LREIARVTGVSWSWLQNYVNNKLAAVSRQVKVSDKPKGKLVRECDEMWSLAFSKTIKVYICLVIDRKTRKIIGCYLMIVGSTLPLAKLVLSRLTARLINHLPINQSRITAINFAPKLIAAIPNKIHLIANLSRIHSYYPRQQIKLIYIENYRGERKNRERSQGKNRFGDGGIFQ
jgi:hypothetical protein